MRLRRPIQILTHCRMKTPGTGHGRGFATISWAIRSNFGVIYSVIGTSPISSESEADFTVSLSIMLALVRPQEQRKD